MDSYLVVLVIAMLLLEFDDNAIRDMAAEPVDDASTMADAFYGNEVASSMG